MNPLFSEAAASVIRSILKLGAGYLVARGVWDEGAAAEYVAAAALAIVGFGWSYWTTYASRKKLVTAMAMPAAVSERQVEAAIKDPAVLTPPVTLHKDAVSLQMDRPPEQPTTQGDPPPKAA
jgi:hypothetical protein